LQTEDTEESEIDSDEMGSNRYMMSNAVYEEESDDETAEGSKAKDGGEKKFKFQQPVGFGRFPSFHGFEELLDFGDLEEEEIQDGPDQVSAEQDDAQEEMEMESDEK